VLPKTLSHPPKRKKLVEFSVDRSNLKSFVDPSQTEEDPTKTKVPKEELSPLAKDLLSYIQLKGPITLHDFMSQTANHLLHGYYQSSRDKIGGENQGDFITAPELSQLFGEMIGVYCLSTYQEMGEPPVLQLIECGPGKGTLMFDILKLSKRFPKFQQSLQVHFVELSQELRKVQWSTLQNLSNDPNAASASAAELSRIEDDVVYEIPVANGAPIKVTWHSFFNQVPVSEPPLPCIILGQEFLDAFPVHQFSYTDKGWREKLVDVDASPYSPYHFRFVLSPNETPAIKSLLGGNNNPHPSSRFASRSANAVLTNLTSQLNQRAAAGVVRTPSVSAVNSVPVNNAVQVGDGIEVSPLALSSVEDMAKRLHKHSAPHSKVLLIDYGENFTQEDSLRAFWKHKQVHALSQPGWADVTADVDFRQCRLVVEQYLQLEARRDEALQRVKNVGNENENETTRGRVNHTTLEIPPLQSQGEFLVSLGVVQRVQQLIDLESTSEEDANLLFRGLKMLVQPEHMGKKFKVMQIVNKPK
jgi:NADH dehydrogenase [ubiquinone] 1 alpha subcomplex assembly factor 7